MPKVNHSSFFQTASSYVKPYIKPAVLSLLLTQVNATENSTNESCSPMAALARLAIIGLFFAGAARLQMSLMKE